MVKSTKQVTEKKKKPTKKETVTETPNGVVEGLYSTTVYENGEKIDFQINWDKLKDYMKTV